MLFGGIAHPAEAECMNDPTIRKRIAKNFVHKLPCLRSVLALAHPP